MWSPKGRATLRLGRRRILRHGALGRPQRSSPADQSGDPGVEPWRLCIPWALFVPWGEGGSPGQGLPQDDKLWQSLHGCGRECNRTDRWRQGKYGCTARGSDGRRQDGVAYRRWLDLSASGGRFAPPGLSCSGPALGSPVKMARLLLHSPSYAGLTASARWGRVRQSRPVVASDAPLSSGRIRQGDREASGPAANEGRFGENL
jgi:hypothetical protein